VSGLKHQAANNFAIRSNFRSFSVPEVVLKLLVKPAFGAGD